MVDHRFGWVEWGPHGERRRTAPTTWNNPPRWNANAPAFVRAHGHRPRVFCASLADWLDNKAPREWRADLGRLIRVTPRLGLLLPPKPPEKLQKLAARDLPNILATDS